MEQQDLLLDLEQSIVLEKATTGARFGNLLIDGIFLGILQRIVSSFFTFTLLRSSEIYSNYRDNMPLYFFYVYVYSYFGSKIFSTIYYTLMEGSTQGRTLGKLITGTQAVKLDGTPITWKDAFLRSLSRLVPFEAFSGFGTPWHDRWTNTQVIKIRK